MRHALRVVNRPESGGQWTPDLIPENLGMTSMRLLPVLLLSIFLVQSALAADPGGFKLGDRLQQGAAKPAANFREISWDDLAPEDWDPMAGIKIDDFAKLEDGDPRADKLLKQMLDAWKKAPVVPALNKQRVRLAGFVVSLDPKPGQLREFLLVPYFGACIHSPPPPANQAIHVVMDKPFAGQMMEPFWISGELSIARSDSPFGSAAYRMRGMQAQRYQAPGP